MDSGIALAVLAAHTAPFLVTTRVAAPETGWTLAQYLPVLGEALPLLWRRRAPLLVFALVILATAAYTLNDPDTARQPVAYAALVATYTLAAAGSSRQRARGLALLGVGAALELGGVVLHAGAETVVHGIVMYAAAWAAGRATAHRQAHARQLERERELEAQRAAARERAVIARDMHDILGHAISLMIVQAEAGPVVVRSKPERAERAFDDIAAAGRNAMTQVRWLLGLLDRPADGGAPTADQIPTLVEGVARAGPKTSLEVSGTPRPLAPDAELAAYRAVQEALTNAIKHANAAEISVTLDWRADDLLITVTDDGRGDTGGTNGHGLDGVRERALACGGSAEFGPGPGGRGCSVAVRLPVERQSK
ncbi:histidine kinase [Saccharopolyspora indica]|uniref:sensor histidine kinase n=1 Tax=Saccharopolyspora indica TaxID=1229659 RepID=UPI0022EA5D5B|nr:histidine kinase [Saccharopolyspora indica]MDA3646754.1 histidine kinase [Saccharopolyspora indica]